MYVPVVSKSKTPLMPCHPARARELVREGRAVRRFKAGMYYIEMTNRVEGEVQPVAAAVDPGSKKEGYSVLSEKRTFLNIQADAVTHVKSSVGDRAEARRSRRYRNTPCRANRQNRGRGGIPPSTKARWGAKVRMFAILRALYPISVQGVEDIKAPTKEGSANRKWNTRFSPLEVGKAWCYAELRKYGELKVYQGYETAELRRAAGLPKLKNKLAENFYAHGVDAYVLARTSLGLPVAMPDNVQLHLMSPLRFHRRELHRRQPSEGGVRNWYGSTRSEGFTRGSLIKHVKYGVAYVGGTMAGRISLHNRKSGKRLCQNAKPSECDFICYNAWRVSFAIDAAKAKG